MTYLRVFAWIIAGKLVSNGIQLGHWRWRSRERQ